MKRLMEKARIVSVVGAFFASAFAVAAQPEAVPGEFIVKLKQPLSTYKNQMNVLSQELGSYIKSTIPGQNIVVIKRPVFEIQSTVVKSLSQDPNVEVIEPNYIYRANRTPNDPMLGQLWGMLNVGQKDSAKQPGVAGTDIGAVQAWDIETGSKDVIVAVIDTGVDYTNADLTPNMWTNNAELNGKAGIDDDGNGVVDDVYGYNAINNSGDPKDDHGHGSHCSGTIGAKGDDGKGIVGVAWNTRIMGVKFLDANGSGTLENAIKGIEYATKMGAKIMSNSWGGGGFSQTLKDAIEASNTAGALFVAAAGNEANNNDANPSYPASYQIANVLSVAAVDNKGNIASFSNYGKTSVHVGAPGVNILSTTTNGYESWSGTSMATPHVSGIAALLASHDRNLSNIELKNRIITTARPLPALRGKVRGAGFANAYAALTNTLPPVDVNDPANWQSVAQSVSSAHPYKEKSTETFEVNVPGAKEIALYFSKFQTERGYDTVQFFNAQGKMVGEMSGNNDDSFSPVIAGDYVKIVFKSDDSINQYGFDITKASWR
ncbi:S8 family serine peptidase [Bdellovibrio sp. HCB337]|uniref:S8 family serine peptidase n=1 Tax=Bdellovibrio sp. HCB337 TaxID=3394358 RepID=UPI0039A6A734